jgi:hypothetical protein
VCPCPCEILIHPCLCVFMRVCVCPVCTSLSGGLAPLPVVPAVSDCVQCVNVGLAGSLRHDPGHVRLCVGRERKSTSQMAPYTLYSALLLTMALWVIGYYVREGAIWEGMRDTEQNTSGLQQCTVFSPYFGQPQPSSQTRTMPKCHPIPKSPGQK